MIPISLSSPWEENSAELGIGFVQDVMDLLTDVLDACVDFVFVIAWGIIISGGGAPGVRSMEFLSWKCRGTSVGEEKNSSYSSTTLSIYCSHAGQPCFEAVATIFFFPCELVVRKINFLVLETILLHYFAIVKEMAGGGTTSSILCNLFPKVITT